MRIAWRIFSSAGSGSEILGGGREEDGNPAQAFSELGELK